MSTTRLEGFARDQLSMGRGAGSIVHDLTRRGAADRETAQSIVERVWPEVQEQNFRRRRSFFRIGVLLLFVPLAFCLQWVPTMVFFPESAHVPPWPDLVATFILVPFISLPTIFGIAFVAYGWSGRRLRKSPPPGSVDYWHAEPFERP